MEIRPRIVRLLVILVLLAIVSSLVGCGLGSRSGDAPDTNTLKIALNTPVINPGLAFIWVGIELGYYSEENIELEIVTSQGTAQATQWVATGVADIAFPPPSALLNAAAQGQDLDLVSVYLINREPVYEVLTLPDSPVQNLADLKNTRIGVVSLGDESAVYAEATMDELGYSPDDFALIAVGTGVQAATQLRRGEVDALVIGDVDRVLTERQGFSFRRLESPQFAQHIFGNQVVVQRDFLSENEEILEGFLRALAKGTLFTTANPEAAIRIHYDLFPETLPQGMSLDEAVETNLATLTVRIPKLTPDEEEGEKWGANDLQDWLAYISYLGLGAEIADPAPFFTNELVDEVNEFDAEAVRRSASEYQRE